MLAPGCLLFVKPLLRVSSSYAISERCECAHGTDRSMSKFSINTYKLLQACICCLQAELVVPVEAEELIL